MFLTNARDRQPGLEKPDATTQNLLLATLAVCSIAPLLTLLLRSGKAPPEQYLIFQRLFFFNDHVGSLAVLVALVVALSMRSLQEAVVRFAAWVGEHPAPTIATAFVVLALCSRFVYLAHPLSMDEYSPWMQAHAFAQGRLAAHYPPDLLDAIVPRHFQNYFITVNRATGEAASAYWPGLALLLTPFVWLDLGWCLNPALAALTLAVLHRLATEASGDTAAGGWAVLAALASPQFTVTSISFYAMAGELALNVLFLWLLLRPKLRFAFLAGLVGGLALAMHNPLPHALMALPCLLWLAWDPRRWGRLAAVLVGYVPLVLVLGAGWWTVRSSLPQAMPPAEAVLSATAPGNIFATAFAILQGALWLPTDDVLVARWYATWKIWIWACPGFLLLLFLPRARSAMERLLLAGFALTYVFYFFVRHDQGHGWGYRYIHTAWAAVPVVAGLWLAGASHLQRCWGAAMVAAGLLATPVFMAQTHGSLQDALAFRLTPSGPGEWVVFVAQNTGRYRGDLVQNPPGETRLLHLVSGGDDKDRALMERHFPEGVLVEQDRRGSAWRLPEGTLAKRLVLTR